MERIHRVQHRLILQAIVLGVEIAAAGLEGGGIAFVVPQLGEAFVDGLSLGDGLQIGEGELVLSGDPLGDGRRLANVLLQPAIGIGDLDAVVVVGMVDAFRFGIRQVLFAARMVVMLNSRLARKKSPQDPASQHHKLLSRGTVSSGIECSDSRQRTG